MLNVFRVRALPKLMGHYTISGLRFLAQLAVPWQKPKVTVGQHIQAGCIAGRIVRLGIKTVTLVTEDGLTLIVPRKRLLDEQANDVRKGPVSMTVPVYVHYRANLSATEKAIHSALKECAVVRYHPSPEVSLVAINRKTLSFQAVFWLDPSLTDPLTVKHEVNYAILDRLTRAEIPLPE